MADRAVEVRCLARRVRRGQTMTGTLPVLDQRQLTAAVVVDSGRPQLAVHVGYAAEDVAAVAWVGSRVNAPGAVGALQNQVVVVVGGRVHVGPDGPNAAARRRDAPEVGPVGAVGNGGQRSVFPRAVLVALAHRLAAPFRAFRFSPY